MNIFKPMEKLKELCQAEHPPDAIVKVVQYLFITCLAIREGVGTAHVGAPRRGGGAWRASGREVLLVVLPGLGVGTVGRTRPRRAWTAQGACSEPRLQPCGVGGVRW